MFMRPSFLHDTSISPDRLFFCMHVRFWACSWVFIFRAVCFIITVQFQKNLNISWDIVVQLPWFCLQRNLQNRACRQSDCELWDKPNLKKLSQVLSPVVHSLTEFKCISTLSLSNSRRLDASVFHPMAGRLWWPSRCRSPFWSVEAQTHNLEVELEGPNSEFKHFVMKHLFSYDLSPTPVRVERKTQNVLLCRCVLVLRLEGMLWQSWTKTQDRYVNDLLAFQVKISAKSIILFECSFCEGCHLCIKAPFYLNRSRLCHIVCRMLWNVCVFNKTCLLIFTNGIDGKVTKRRNHF